MTSFTATQKMLYLVTATDNTSRKAWYYVWVRPEFQGAFKRKLATKNLVLTEFGAIVESGYGEAPPPSVAEKMRQMSV